MKKQSTTNKPRRPSTVLNRKNGVSCYFTQSKSKPDYKDVLILKRFVNERGKIIRQTFSGLTAKNQRMLSQAVKRARYMALLPYTEKHAL